MKILLSIMLLLLVIIFLNSCCSNRRTKLSPFRRIKTEEQRMIDFEWNGIPY